MRIALCGEPRSGKDTVATLFQQELSYMVRLAFGDYMKERYYEDNPPMRNKPKDREHMIAWSQPKVEKDNNIWVRKLECDFIDYRSNYISDFVITDLRQPHEEKWCRENGFHIVRVHSSEIVRVERARNKGEHLGKDLPHWVQADYHIYNDGSLEDLQSQIDNLLDCLNEIEMKRRRL